MKSRYTLLSRLFAAAVMLTASVSAHSIALASDGGLSVKGIVAARPASGTAGTWQIGPVAVLSGAATQFPNGIPDVGACVRADYVVLNAVNHAVDITPSNDCATSTPMPVIVSVAKGIIGSRPASTLFGPWIIAGVSYQATDGVTEFVADYGPLDAGACARVAYFVQDGARVARQMESLSPSECLPVHQARGIIHAVPADGQIGRWVIGEDGYVSVALVTRFDTQGGPLDVGACAEVAFVALADHNLALGIKSESPDDCAGHEEHTAFGEIVSLPDTPDLAGTWNIGGLPYEVISTTELSHGPFTTGLMVKVEFVQVGDLRTAVEIEAKPEIGQPERERAKVRGLVMTRPLSPTILGAWTIASATLTATEVTRADGSLQIGDCAEAVYLHTPGGDFALRISREDDCAAEGHPEFGRGYGFIRSMPLSDTIGIWVVGGALYSVTAETIISETHGPAAVGAFVRVLYVEQVHDVKTALSIETLVPPLGGDVRALGRVTFGPGLGRAAAVGTTTWFVNGKAVQVTDATMINDAAVPLTSNSAVVVNAATDPATGNTVATSLRTVLNVYSIYVPLAEQ